MSLNKSEVRKAFPFLGASDLTLFPLYQLVDFRLALMVSETSAPEDGNLEERLRGGKPSSRSGRPWLRIGEQYKRNHKLFGGQKIRPLNLAGLDAYNGPTISQEARMNLGRILVLGVLLVGFGGAATPPAVEKGVAGFLQVLFPIPSATGNEDLLAAKIRQLLPPNLSFETDNLGGLYAKVGGEAAGLAILTPMDEFGYVVSGITPEGFLTVDRSSTPPVPIYDSFLMGHPVVLSTRKGIQHGIVVQPAMHVLTRERRDLIANNLTLDMIYIDIGVRTEAEARAKGIEILDPVTQWPDFLTLANGRAAGPSLGQKAACAALAAAAVEIGRAKPASGATFVWMAQSRLAARGARGSLGATRARNKLSPKAALILDIVAADRGEKGPVLGNGPVLVLAKEGPSVVKDAVEAAAKEKGISLQSLAGVESAFLGPFVGSGIDAVILALPAKFAGTPSEVIEMKDAQALADIVAAVVASGRVK